MRMEDVQANNEQRVEPEDDAQAAGYQIEAVQAAV